VIDVDTLAVDSPDYDLARTWYRWPMEAGQFSTYLEGYRRVGSTLDFEEYALYWRIAVLVESALFRLVRRTGRSEVPMRRLRELLNEASSPPAS
jgi:hypothetical protein